MRFIPKKKLQEAETNPLNVNTVDLSYDEQYKQAILNAIASETAARNEYEQILAIEPHVTTQSLKDLFHDTLVDISNEEMKHIAQLNTGVSKIPEIKELYKAGEEEAETGEDKGNKEQKESMTESMDRSFKEETSNTRMYSAETITAIILSEFGLELNDPKFDEINSTLDPKNKNILNGKEVDEGMLRLAQKYQFTYDEVESLENKIAYSKDPVAEKAEDQQNDIESDISVLNDLLPNLHSQETRDRLQNLIDELNMPKMEA